MEIHIGKTPSQEGWVGFETDPYLAETKKRLNERCLPCMTGLYQSLKDNPREVELTYAWDCWKVVALAASREQCIEMLHQFGADHPEEYVLGKFGKGGGGHSTFALMFHVESEERRDHLHGLLRGVLDERCPGTRTFCSRGCGDPYERLLGPWPEWEKTCKIRHPERVAEVRRSLRDSLYRR